MRTIQWKVMISDENKIASIENAIGFPQDQVESHLTIIGLLENLKQKHLDKLNTLFEKTVRKGDKKDDFDL
jgi:hypothetical protein